MPMVKLYSRYIRFHNAKAPYWMATRDYFGFSLLEQTMANSTTPVLAKHP